MELTGRASWPHGDNRERPLSEVPSPLTNPRRRNSGAFLLKTPEGCGAVEFEGMLGRFGSFDVHVVEFGHGRLRGVGVRRLHELAHLGAALGDERRQRYRPAGEQVPGE